MAIRIPILTSFDPKGLRQANAQFEKLQGSIGSLGRNFAIAGAAIAGAGLVLGKTVQTASSYAESVNAVNVAFGKSAQGIIDFGKTAATTLGVSQVDFNNAAVRFSAFAERIVGSGGDASKFIAEISTRASDFASVFNIEVSEALQVFQSGLSGEAEPLKRFGINLLETEVKAFAVRTEMIKQGETMTEQQKVLARYGLIMESTNKTAGDFANTSDGLANQMRILQAEVSNTEIEIGNALLPVMQELLPIVRDLVRDLGSQLVTAVKAVDWQALATSVMNFTRFIVENATTIANLVIGIFALNTAYKAMVVVSATVKTALALQTYFVAQATAGVTLKTIAVKQLTAAMKLVPFVAVVAGIVSISDELIKASDNFKSFREQIDQGATSMSQFDENLAAVSATFLTFDIKGNPFLQFLQDAIVLALRLTGALNNIPGKVPLNLTDNTGKVPAGLIPNQTPVVADLPGAPTPTSSGGGPKQLTIGQQLKREATLVKKQTKLIGAGVSEGLAARLTSGAAPVKRANKALAAIQKNNGKLTKNLRKMEKNLRASSKVVVDSASEQVEAIQDTSVQDALNARQRAAESFADSVKNTFASIKNSILEAFDLTQLGGSTNAITRNMDKLLVRLRSFATNVSKLSGMGLNATLLQQVISAGPMAGARLAESLVMGGTGALAAINAGFTEFGSLSGQIAQTGTEAMFNRTQQGSVYNINVDGGVGSGATIGKAIVDAIAAYERTSGAVWQRA
jgi:hypothetical protein